MPINKEPIGEEEEEEEEEFKLIRVSIGWLDSVGLIVGVDEE